jgi:toxin CcdB
LVVQSELLEALPTVVVIPLVRKSMLGGQPAERLNPELRVGGESVYLLTQQLGAVTIHSLTKYLGNLDDARDGITLALDFLFTGI